MQILILQLTGEKKTPQGLSNNKPLFGNKSELMNLLLKKVDNYLDIEDFTIGFLIVVGLF